MKLLFITNIPSPYRIDFFNELGKFHDLTVVFEAKSAKGIQFDFSTNDNFTFRAIFLKESDIEENKVNIKISKFIRRNQYDLVFVTNYAYYTEIFGLLLIKIKRIPYILEIDGGILRKENKVKRCFKKLLIGGANKYFSPSDMTDQYLINYGVKLQEIYRYPFTSLKQKDIIKSHVMKMELRKKLGIKEEKVLLAVGQFIHRKGYDLLLSACKDLSDDVGIYIVGNGSTEDYDILQQELHLVNIYFVPFQNKEKLKEYYQSADIFVHPTREDIWGLVINEAMAQGLPIITTTACVAGVELIKDMVNGLIIPKDDIRALREAIDFLLYNEQLIEKMRANNIKKIEQYTIETMVSVHNEIINKGSKL